MNNKTLFLAGTVLRFPLWRGIKGEDNCVAKIKLLFINKKVGDYS